ncbi:beta-lactamase domain-containing protein [Ectopseudomonas mendocina DLHK]|nr:beta-lactamase domain-containing protein [Pseudomonas mendocina DLHK]
MDAEHALLFDCGLFQGAETSPEGRGRAGRLDIDFSLAGIRALIATHVHIDHVGRIPYLLAAGFKGPILCSEPSAKLLPIVLEDAFELGFSRDQAKVGRYLKLIEQRIVALPYKTWFNLVDSAQLMARIRLQRAGHILGSAYVEVDLHYPLTGKRKRVVFSGDLGAPHAPILPAPKAPQRADILVIESTYGDRLHEDRRKRLEQILEQALADRGTVLIPAFSIGRTQELLYELEEILHRRASSKRAPVNGIDWHNLPIILDSPLAGRFTLVYRELEPFWDAEALARVRSGRKPLAFDNLLTVDSRHARLAMVKRLVQTAQPAIVIAGNGMCSSGRIVSYLKTMHRRCHAQRFVRRLPGRGTTGRQIQRFGSRGRFVIMDGQPYDIRGQIHTIGGYSAHADQNGLLGFVTRMRHWPSEVRIVHGDPAVKQALADALQRGYSQRSRA